MKHLLLSLTTSLCLPCLGGQTAEPTRFSRGDAGLVISQRDLPDRGLLTQWRGRIQLRGNLVFEFKRVPAEQNERFPEGASYFEPDARSLAKLPAALNNLPASPGVIEIQRTPREVLTPILGASATEAMVQGSQERYVLAADVWLVMLSTSLDCDRRHYALEYEKIKRRMPTLLSESRSRHLGC